MMAQFVHQQEIGKLLKLPPSTVKLWLGYYAAFISPVQLEDKVVYTEDVLGLFLRIKAFRADRYHLSTITRLLIEEGFPLYIVKPGSSNPQTPNPPGQEEPSSGESQEPEVREVIERISTELTRICDELNQLIRR